MAQFFDFFLSLLYGSRAKTGLDAAFDQNIFHRFHKISNSQHSPPPYFARLLLAEPPAGSVSSQ